MLLKILASLPVLAFLLAALPAAAEGPVTVAATWALDPGADRGVYTLASPGAPGTFVICFEAGNVGRVAVSAGEARSHLARGACTVFVPTETSGIVLDHISDAAGVAYGTFRVILPAD